MMEIICCNESYTYNAYHIMKAFYPAGNMVARVDEKASNYVEAVLPNGSRLAISREKELTKKELDRALYRKLKEITGRSLAWGVLTGVRPTKIAMKKLEEGMDKGAFVQWFQKENLASEEKTILAWEIANREKELLDRLDYENGYSLYVGIPFCPSVCSYCSFSSGALFDWKDSVEAYLDALCKELAYIGKVSVEKKLNTIYIGGGTPTTLTAGQLKRLLDCIDTYFSREHLLEYTVEAGRPDSITPEKLQVIAEHGISRISINPQTMQQKTLDLIGRKHTVSQIRDAYHTARSLGFDNINMDLIAGLPGEDASDMEDTLRQVEEMHPDSLTVHALAIKRAARYGQEGRKQDLHSEISQMIMSAADCAKRIGLQPYYLYRQKNIAGNFENVGYAELDKAGIYNILIMEEKQTILAAGAGASTKFVFEHGTRIERVENVKDVNNYILRIDEMLERKRVGIQKYLNG